MHDALTALVVLDGETLTGAARDAADLLAMDAGQDVAEGGVFRIVRGVTRTGSSSQWIPKAHHGAQVSARR